MIKVMLVDDEPWNREIVKRFGVWDKYNMEIVCEANDGAEAIEYMEQHQLQLVITDMRMPGIGGGRLMEYIRQHDPDMQLIIISGYDDFEYARQALRNNAIEYLLKPIEAAALNAALGKCYEFLLQQQAVVDISTVYALNAHKMSIEQVFNKLQEQKLWDILAQLEGKWAKKQLPAALKQQLYDELWKLTNELSERFGLALSKEAKPSIQSWDEVAARFLEAFKQLKEQRKYKTKLNVLDVRSYIDQYAKEPIALDDLASTFFVSKEYLSKQFKHELGVNVTDYIIGLRMEEAKQQVEEGKLSFKEIAELVGYEDISYFYRVFRKYFGVAPGEMRKQHEV